MDQKAKGFIEDSFVASGVRGLDSSGVFQVDRKLELYLHKLAVAGHVFIGDRTTRGFITDASDSLFTVGHVRAATEGRVRVSNAHPFCTYSKEGKRFVGVHNGTLTRWRSHVKGANPYDVDSEWAINELCAEGADAFEKFEGSYSLVWWDERSPTVLNFARNKERPMYFLRTKDKKTILFASESGMLSWLALRNNLDVEDVVYTTDVDKLYTIDVNNAELVWEDKGFLPVKKVAHSPSASEWLGRGSFNNPMYNDDEWDGEYTFDQATKTYEFKSSSYGRDGILEAVKSVLKKVRLVRDGNPEASTGDNAMLDKALAIAMDNDEEEEQMEMLSNGDGTFAYSVPTTWYDVRGASNKEIQHAKKKQWFGELVSYEDAEYDEETSEVLGIVADPIEDNLIFTAVMRGLDKFTFALKLHDKTTSAVIIGSRENSDGVEYILAPLTKTGEEGLKRAAA